MVEILGVLGFILALATFVITRIEKKKKLLIDLYCQNLEELDKDNEFYCESKSSSFERVIVVDIINEGSKSVAIDKNSIKLLLNKQEIQNHLDWIGKLKFNNPINPGQNYKFGVCLDSAISLSKIKKIDECSIRAEVKDSESKKYFSNKNLKLNLVFDEIIRT